MHSADSALSHSNVPPSVGSAKPMNKYCRWSNGYLCNRAVFFALGRLQGWTNTKKRMRVYSPWQLNGHIYNAFSIYIRESYIKQPLQSNEHEILHILTHINISPKALFRRRRRRFSTCETPPGVLQVVNLEVFHVGKSPRFSMWETSLTEQLFSCARIALWGDRGVRKLPEIAPAQNNFYSVTASPWSFDIYNWIGLCG